MNVFNSSNGYCNVWVVGQPGIGKTFLVENLFEQLYRINNNNPNDIEFDALISEQEHNVKIRIKEIRSFEDPIFNSPIQHNDIPSVFLIVGNLYYYENISYEKDFIKKIENRYPDALIYLIRINSSLNISKDIQIKKEGIISTLPKIGKNLREIFFINSYGQEDFFIFQNILKNSIINFCTDRLKHVKKKINDSIKFGDEYLDIGKCNLTSLYEVPELFQCNHIKTLIISNEWGEFRNGKWHKAGSENRGGKNNFGIIPAEIIKLKNLNTFIAGGDWNTDGIKGTGWRIKELGFLTKLTKLKYINFSNNRVDKIPSLSQLLDLEVLHLNNNCITSIALNGEFKLLRELYLSNNSLKTVSFFIKIKIPNISTIDLHGNEITDLTPIKSLIEKKDIVNSKWEQNTISIAKNPLQKPPLEIVNIGKMAVLKYFEDINKGKHYINNEVKLILVGNSEVGKTTLAKYLDDENDLNVKHCSTHWLEERKVTSKHLLDEIKQKCTINLFDFGGHDFFHDTHHLFFSSNTIYILLWDVYSNCLNKRTVIQEVSKGIEKEVEFQDFPLKYWLDSIKYYVQDDKIKIFDFQIDNINEFNSDVLVVQNKVVNQDEIVFLNSEELKKEYPFIYDFINISVIEKRRTDYFDVLLSEMLNNMQIVGAKLPNYYGKVKDSISKYQGDAIINLKEFVIFCNSIKGVNIDIEQAKILANYLNQIGLIMHYPNSIYNDLIFIDKKWVLNKIYKILGGLYEKGGEFDLNYVKEIFENYLTEDEVNNILSLMKGFNIIFQNPYKKTFIAPLYLPKKPDELLNLFIQNDKKPYRKFLYKGFIHKNVILQIFREYGEYVIGEKKGSEIYYYYWKNGLIIKDPVSNEIVKIIFNLGDDTGNASIDLFKLNNDFDTNFVDQIIDTVNKINYKYDVEEMITIDGEDYIPIKVIHENEDKNNWTFFYNEKYYKLTKFKKYLHKPDVMKKIFISYSKQDLKLVNKFIEHLASLQLDGKVSHWYCSELEAGSEWNQEIQKNFDESDIICFMISPNFMKTKYIHEHEIAKAFEKKATNQDLRIVPIILDFCRWTTENNNLGKYTALPYTAKPVVDFDNQNMAWYIIEECIRIMIDKNLEPEGDDFYQNNLPTDVLKIYERIVGGKVDKNTTI
ncbi:hypothetical protein FCR2A7T_24540 [Flavobacterium cauense R2A-7]|uniref:Leucine rich repeat (LRR) protein n=1 Tax=Flavobacterium cauense R2A-7 TaxID=1341154 RepID=V6S3T0_9FLAO|nr:COR domain-containing protein [Flavobacterium cauense]ESU19040.1 hypothetical protein FCR2A7T_24540 [Flavobacterium cauense R2A-7]KGO82330.1 hypothetical protein Q762_06545 [Flavobacterium cauense R2A-7]TWI15296.1 leucine rich repeat (LRR) protein [Flavobacterium cauense R2A-7]